MDAVEIRTIAKVTSGLVPFLLPATSSRYLDRVNVGFAALQMNQELGLSHTAFRIRRRYLSSLRISSSSAIESHARTIRCSQWIARIMLSWGFCRAPWHSSPPSPTSPGSQREQLLLVRVLLGAREAASSPGIIFYLHCGFARSIGRDTSATFMAAIRSRQ